MTVYTARIPNYRPPNMTAATAASMGGVTIPLTKGFDPADLICRVLVHDARWSEDDNSVTVDFEIINPSRRHGPDPRPPVGEDEPLPEDPRPTVEQVVEEALAAAREDGEEHPRIGAGYQVLTRVHGEDGEDDTLGEVALRELSFDGGPPAPSTRR